MIICAGTILTRLLPYRNRVTLEDEVNYCVDEGMNQGKDSVVRDGMYRILSVGFTLVR
jgi:hypothetical protein